VKVRQHDVDSDEAGAKGNMSVMRMRAQSVVSLAIDVSVMDSEVW
jgi:hypothetical protein